MKLNRYLIPCAALISLGITAPIGAQSSIQHSGQAIIHSANAFGHSIEGGAKLVSGVVAIPLVAAGAVGELSGEVGNALWETANAPLPISDEVVTVGPPPSEAIQAGGNKQWQ